MIAPLDPATTWRWACVSFLWIAPILWVVVISFRSFDDVAANGLGSLPHSFTFSTYKSAWEDADEFRALINSSAGDDPGGDAESRARRRRRRTGWRGTTSRSGGRCCC